jgi:hypothetical protein
MVEFFGEDTRKVFADEYWDDRARRMPSDKRDEYALRVALRIIGHYAHLLNRYDGGDRIEELTVKKWKQRFCADVSDTRCG